MIEEFDGLPFAGGTVNGTLTVTENVADAGGLSCALEALKQTEDEPDLEAFFTSWARAWRNKATEAYMNLNLTMDVHAPSKLRANIQLQNLDDFFTTFGIERATVCTARPRTACPSGKVFRPGRLCGRGLRFRRTLERNAPPKVEKK